MIYIATPYSHKDTAIQQQRFEQTEAITAHFKKAGHVVISPIVHSHEMAKKYRMPTHFEFWRDYCIGLLDAASELWVIKLPGWEQSIGVQAEIDHAKQRGLQIVYINPGDCKRCRGVVIGSDSHWCDQCHYPGIEDDWQQYQNMLDEGHRAADAAVLAGWKSAEEV